MLVAFSVSPSGGDDTGGVGAAVAEAIRIVRASGLPNETNAMFTNIEGEWDEVMAVVTACFERMRQDCNRISTSIRIDYRAGPGGRLESKIASIESKLGRKLST